MRSALERLFKCECITVVERGALTRSDGRPTFPVYAFIRTVNGRMLDAQMVVEHEDLPVTRHELDRVCRLLEIDDAAAVMRE